MTRICPHPCLRVRYIGSASEVIFRSRLEHPLVAVTHIRLLIQCTCVEQQQYIRMWAMFMGWDRHAESVYCEDVERIFSSCEACRAGRKNYDRKDFLGIEGLCFEIIWVEIVGKNWNFWIKNSQNFNKNFFKKWQKFSLKLLLNQVRSNHFQQPIHSSHIKHHKGSRSLNTGRIFPHKYRMNNTKGVAH